MKPTQTDAEHYHQVVDCQWACPAHTDVPEYIRLIAQGRFGDAYLLNRSSNVFPGILGRVCDRPCEPACRRGRANASMRQAIPAIVAILTGHWRSGMRSRHAFPRSRSRWRVTLRRI